MTIPAKLDAMIHARDALCAALQPIAEKHIDSGLGLGGTDLWVTIGGVEFLLTMRFSNSQLAKWGEGTPGELA